MPSGVRQGEEEERTLGQEDWSTRVPNAWKQAEWTTTTGWSATGNDWHAVARAPWLESVITTLWTGMKRDFIARLVWS